MIYYCINKGHFVQEEDYTIYLFFYLCKLQQKQLDVF